MNKTCIYYCEGEDDKKLVDALKATPGMILPGKSKRLNVVQTRISSSILLGIRPGSTIVFVFDTDVSTNLEVLRDNIKNIGKYCRGTKLVFLLQVRNLEEELVRCTDVKTIMELTKSKTVSDFKTDFAKMKDSECRNVLERHKLDIRRLWDTRASETFGFIEQNSRIIKTKQ